MSPDAKEVSFIACLLYSILLFLFVLEVMRRISDDKSKSRDNKKNETNEEVIG